MDKICRLCFENVSTESTKEIKVTDEFLERFKDITKYEVITSLIIYLIKY